MIPNKNLQNENGYKQKIKIQLTNDNRCIIQSTLETPNKSQNNLVLKSEQSINMLDYNNIENYNDNDLMSLSKSVNSISNMEKQNHNNNTNKNNNFDVDGNSNLLISFSNISELTKTNIYDNSVLGGVGESGKKNNSPNRKTKENKDNEASLLTPPLCNYYDNSNIKENNKENMDINNNKNMSINMGICNKSEYSNDKYNLVSSSKKSNNNTNNNIYNIINQDNSNISKQLLDSFNKNNLSEISDIVNLNMNDKSELFDKNKENSLKNEDLKKRLSNDLNSIDIKDNFNILEKKEKKENKNDKPEIKSNIDLNKKINGNNNAFVGNKKMFKNIKSENTDNLNIINSNIEKGKVDEYNINKANIIPNHCTNFSFGGNVINNNINHFMINNINNINIENVASKLNLGNANCYNDPIKNDDYISPTFNINLDFNSLDNNNIKKESYNNININNNKNEKSEKNEKNNKNPISNNNNEKVDNNNVIKEESKQTSSINNKIGKTTQINNKYKKQINSDRNKSKNLIKENSQVTNKSSSNSITQNFIYKEKRNQSSSNINNSEKINYNKILNSDFNNIGKINRRKHSYLDSNKNVNNNILNRLYGTNSCQFQNNQNTIQNNNNDSNANTKYSNYPKNKVNHNKSKSNSNNLSKTNSKEDNLIIMNKILLKNKSSVLFSQQNQSKTNNDIKSKSQNQNQNKINANSNNISNNNSNGSKNSAKNKIKIINKDKIDILEIRKKIRKSPVPKVNKLSPASKIKTNMNFNNSNNVFKEKKYGEYNTKTENIFNGHLNNINLEEKKKKLNIGSKKTSPKSWRSGNNNEVNKKNNFLNKNIGEILVDNNNLKVKISKKAINSCLNDYKPNLSDYSDGSYNKIQLTNYNKNKSFIYNRKRNCSFSNNISNKEKDATNKNYHIKLHKTIQSGERNRNINKQNDSKLNSLNSFSLLTNFNNNRTKDGINKNFINSNNYNKQNTINNNNIASKFNNNKAKIFNKHSKKLTVIQNFSQYKKKSTILNTNIEFNDYIVNDENYNGENKIHAKQIKESNYINNKFF